MVYILLILLLLILIYIYDYKRIKVHQNSVFKILLCIFTLLAGLRYRIGTDTVEYMLFYDTVPSLFDLSFSDFVATRYAPLSFLSFSLAKTISSEFVVFQLLISFVVNYSVFRFIRKYGRDGFLFTFLLMYFLTSYYMLNCEVLRESLAVCVFLYSIDSLLERKYFKYFSLCFVALLFHYSALVLLILPLALKVKINKYTISVLIVLYLFSYVLKDYLYLLNYIGSLGGLSERIDIYSESASDKEYVFMNFMGFLINILLPLIAYIYVKRVKNIDNSGFDQFFYLFLLTFVISRSIWIVYRFTTNYFGFFELYYYSCFIYLCTLKLKRFVPAFILVLALLMPRLVYLYSYWSKDFYGEMCPNFSKIEVVYPYTNYLTDKNMISKRESFYRVINQYK